MHDPSPHVCVELMRKPYRAPSQILLAVLPPSLAVAAPELQLSLASSLNDIPNGLLSSLICLQHLALPGIP